MSTLRTSAIQSPSTTNGGISIDTSGHVTVDGVALPSAGPLSNRNLVINGAMQVAQRGTTGTVINSITYLIDRFYGIAQNANVTQSQETSVVPAGFKNSLKFEVTAAGNTGYLQCVQRIEGQNMAHLNFGTANAVQFTLSFYVRSSITGNYSIAFRNASDNRSYVTTYNIATANTWERKTVTLTADTTGTWATNNGLGMSVIWGLGYNSTTSNINQWTATGDWGADGSVDWYETNGATWYITGVQLEVGSVATPFEHRSYGDELARCQRYYQKYSPLTGGKFSNGYAESTTTSQGIIHFPVQMRAAPTSLEQSGTASDYVVRTSGTNNVCSSVPTFQNATPFNIGFTFTVSSGLTVNNTNQMRSNTETGYLAWGAEL